MKALLTTVFTLLMTSYLAFGQISEGVRSMSMGSNNSLSLDIPNSDAKLAKKVWSTYIKKNAKGGKTKSNRKTGETFTDDAGIVSIGGANTVDVYAKFADAGDMSNVTVWFDLGGAYLNSDDHPDRYQEGEKFLMRFAIAVAVEATKLELKAEEKKKKDMERDLSSLASKKEGYHRDIEEAKAKIADREAKIEQNIKDQEMTKTAIQDQEGVIDAIKERLKELEE